MPELTMAEAAVALGVHLDTIRRRIRRGELAVRRDERGRNLVMVPDVVIPTTDTAGAGPHLLFGTLASGAMLVQRRVSR